MHLKPETMVRRTSFQWLFFWVFNLKFFGKTLQKHLRTLLINIHNLKHIKTHFKTPHTHQFSSNFSSTQLKHNFKSNLKLNTITHLITFTENSQQQFNHFGGVFEPPTAAPKHKNTFKFFLKSQAIDNLEWKPWKLAWNTLEILSVSSWKQFEINLKTYLKLLQNQLNW